MGSKYVYKHREICMYLYGRIIQWCAIIKTLQWQQWYDSYQLDTVESMFLYIINTWSHLAPEIPSVTLLLSIVISKGVRDPRFSDLCIINCFFPWHNDISEMLLLCSTKIDKQWRGGESFNLSTLTGRSFNLMIGNAKYYDFFFFWIFNQANNWKSSMTYFYTLCF